MSIIKTFKYSLEYILSMAKKEENERELRELKDVMESDSAKKPENIPEAAKKEIDELKQKLGSVKNSLLKKFSFISAIGLLHPQAIKIIEEDMLEEEREALSKEKGKIMHIIILVPDDNEKQIHDIKVEAIKLTQNIKPKIWVHIKTIKEVWNLGFDSKYEMLEAVAMAYPLHDSGILGALRVANIHKSLVLGKFEHYIVSYVIAGSLVRGEAKETSDVDVYVIVDDTDVRRMSRYELKEKLRHIIFSYVGQAGELAGVKNKLNVQVYIMTEFWEAVKDAHPVIFTFIRDGVPFYDKGAFMPWKLLLRMGKIKPSPEAIDMFMELGEKVATDVQKKLNDIVTSDLYWGIITPSQAALMLYGVSPPTPKETVALMNQIFVDKEQLLEKKYVDILQKIVSIYKEYEHEENKTITGKEIDDLLKESAEYLTRLKKLMEQIERKAKNKIVIEVYNEVFNLLKKIFGELSESALVKKFNNELVKKGFVQSKLSAILNEIVKANNDYKKKKLEKHEVDRARKSGSEIIAALTDFIHRKEMIGMQKHEIKIFYSENSSRKEGKLFVFDQFAYAIKADDKIVQKINMQNQQIKEILKSEFEDEFAKQTAVPHKLKLDNALYSTLNKIFGKFELIF